MMSVPPDDTAIFLLDHSALNVVFVNPVMKNASGRAQADLFRPAQIHLSDHALGSLAPAQDYQRHPFQSVDHCPIHIAVYPPALPEAASYALRVSHDPRSLYLFVTSTCRPVLLAHISSLIFA